MSKLASERLEEIGRPTIYDVANQAKVSTATVSKVLRGVSTVGTANAARVNEAVRVLAYRRDPLASNLRRSRRALIGLVVPDFKNPFFGALIAEIERCSAQSNFELVTVSSAEGGPGEIRQIEALLDWRVAGIIVIPNAPRFTSGRALDQAGVPTVLLDRVTKGMPFDGVGVDNEVACGRMVQQFYRLGHRELLVAASSPDLPNMRERINGVRKACAEMVEPVAIEILSCGKDLAGATKVVAGRFAAGPPPRAVFALFIEATLAVLREVSHRGLAVPRDLSLAGFDDFEWLQVMHPPVATVIQPIEGMAKAAWARLMQRLEQPESKPELTRVACQIDFRGSLAPPSAADAKASSRRLLASSKTRSPRESGSRVTI